MFHLGQLGTNYDIGMLPADADQGWESLVATAANEYGAMLSPDGEWMAYGSDETGRFEIYLQRFPTLGERQQVSTNGGLEPKWSPDGQTLYYLGTAGGSEPRRMVGVRIDAGPPLSIGASEVLFAYDHFHPGDTARYYDIAPDGQRFLLLSWESGQGGPGKLQVNVVQNWFAELKERVPVD